MCESLKRPPGLGLEIVDLRQKLLTLLSGSTNNG